MIKREKTNLEKQIGFKLSESYSRNLPALFQDTVAKVLANNPAVLKDLQEQASTSQEDDVFYVDGLSFENFVEIFDSIPDMFVEDGSVEGSKTWYNDLTSCGEIIATINKQDQNAAVRILLPNYAIAILC